MPLRARSLRLRCGTYRFRSRSKLDDALGTPDLVNYRMPGDSTGYALRNWPSSWQYLPDGGKLLWVESVSDMKILTNLRIFFRKLERMAGLQRVVERAEGVINLILNDSLRALVIAGRALSNPITKRIV